MNTDAKPNTNPRALLEQFITNNTELERLENLLNQFNIFEAVGMVRQEIRHSRFLAFLLNPNASHQLGDRVLKPFLKRLLLDADNATVSPINIDVADLSDTEVRCEWKNIDILLVSHRSQLVCAIENKVDSGEHSDQLRRYRQIVQNEFINYQHIFVYLTLSGISPQSDDDQQHWLTYSYTQIAELMNDLMSDGRLTINSEVGILIQHYNTLIKRHFMEDSEIAQLCRDIYWKHKDALDLIYEHRPNPEAEIYALVEKLVEDAPADQIELDHHHRARKILSFVVPSWDDFSFQKTSPEWKPTSRILRLQFKVEASHLKFVLTLGPGDDAIRQSIYSALESHNLLGFTHQKPIPDIKWLHLLERAVLQGIGAEMDMNNATQIVQNFWEQFLVDELPKIDEAIAQAFGPSQ